MTKTTTMIETLRTELAACAKAAPVEGLEGPYQVTSVDLEYVRDRAAQIHGRLPTAAEWSEVGIRAGNLADE